MNLTIIVPLYNEDESLPELMAWIHRVVSEHKLETEVLMIDDGSKDRSWEVIVSLQKQYPYLKGIRFRNNYGKSAALFTGFEAAEGDVVITMDADLQDSPDEIPGLYKMIVEDGYDLVSGYKQKRYDPIGKTLPSKFFNFVTRKMSGIDNLHDFNCGLKAYRKEVIKNVELWGDMHRYIPVLAKWAGFDNIAEKVVQHQERKYGVSKFGVSRLVTGFLDLVSLLFIHKYLKKPMHFFGTWGFIFGMIGGGMLSYLAFIRMVLGIWISSKMPAMIFGAVCLLLGFMLFSTGLLAELMSRNSPYKNQYRIKDKI